MRWFVKSRRAQNPDDYETWIAGGVSPTLNAFDNGNDTRATVLMFIADVPDSPTNFDKYNFTGGNDIHHRIRAGTRQSTSVLQEAVVRRLTPIECERLMGWPDNWTLHRADGKTNSDSTRYKMCGNGVATPVAQWIAHHLKDIL